MAECNQGLQVTCTGAQSLAKITTGTLSEGMQPCSFDNCDDYHFLDFIEIIFQVAEVSFRGLSSIRCDPHEGFRMNERVNGEAFFEADDLPLWSYRDCSLQDPSALS